MIVAGGYDERVVENKEHFEELRQLVRDVDLEKRVSFIRSFSDAQKRTLLKYSTCLLYTPDKEHFGIVPIESMYMECPVIAVRSGGPLETVAGGETGYLCDPVPDSFAAAMEKFVRDANLGRSLGRAGRQRVVKRFSFETFTNQLNSVVVDLCTS